MKTKTLILYCIAIILLSCKAVSPDFEANNDEGKYDFEIVSVFESNVALFAVYMLDSLTGWAAGQEYQFDSTIGIPTPQNSLIFRTNDGWETFSSVAYALFHPTDLYFVDTSTGWVLGLGNGHLLETVDGGKTWTERDIGAETVLDAISFKNESTGWIRSGSKMFRTDDGGEEWHRVDYDNNLVFSKIQFASQDTGFCLGSTNSSYSTDGIYKTCDGGDTWDRLYSAISPSISDFCTVDSKSFWGIGSVLMFHADTSQIWKIVSYGVKGHEILFWEDGEAAVIGVSKVYLSHDGGISWTEAIMEEVPFSGIIFQIRDSVRVGKKVYICGNNYILRYDSK